MTWNFAIGCCLCLFIAFDANASTRSALTEECSYTLPGSGWEWLDPKAAAMHDDGDKTVFLARNHSGMLVMVRIRNLEPGYKPGDEPYSAFETALLREEGMKKIGSKSVNFKGVGAHQVDAQAKNGCASVRGFYANDRFYYIIVGNQLGLAPAKETEKIFACFNFIGKPRPMVLPNLNSADGSKPASDDADKKSKDDGTFSIFKSGPNLGGNFFGLTSIGFVALILFGAWVILRIRG